jgi:cytidine deaminase
MASGNRPDLVVGLTSPIGTDLDAVIDHLSQAFREVGYSPEVVHLSKHLAEVKSLITEPEGPTEFDRYCQLMDMGDRFRQGLARGDAMAFFAVSAISRLRETKESATVFIIRSLKRKEELRTLRRIYGSSFLAISATAPRDVRVGQLSRKLSLSNQELRGDAFRDKAEALVLRDEHDYSKSFGQNVRKTFPEGDVFVSTQDPVELGRQVRRFVELLFRHQFHTPTRDEYGMYLAEAAALRSAALGRQVGAVISTCGGDVIAIGANEVPKFGGGLYWDGDVPDRRDFQVGHDANDIMKFRVLGEILKRLKEAGWLAEGVSSYSPTDLTKLALDGESAPLAGAQLDNIIEFGRCVHAEMAAIVDAARRGVRVDDGVLFSTTFPCHECARHIVAAGIRRVVYLLPYPKSLVRELYPDSISVDGLLQNAVAFVPFIGIAPRKYMDFFRMSEQPGRKGDDGRVRCWDKSTALPNLGDYLPRSDIVRTDEQGFLDEIGAILDDKGISLVEN